MSSEDALPIGVGRVPSWWMELTPHYVLDWEEEKARRQQEAAISDYFAHVQMAVDKGLFDIKTGWKGRSENGGSSFSMTGGPGGRNFTIPPLDPKWFGIGEDHPDYHAILTGAKLPPGYEEMMMTYRNGGEMYANNLKQTSFGKYGNQAEKLNFQPSWAKKKLRSTNTGSMIRNGIYLDSPSASVARRMPKPALPPPDFTSDEQAPSSFAAPPVEEMAAASMSDRPQKYGFKDYYYNADAATNDHPEQAPPASPQAYDESEYDEEVMDESEAAGEEEPALVEQAPALSDLQAILAAKQAELARLQAQMAS